jgi:hypothetical protein
VKKNFSKILIGYPKYLLLFKPLKVLFRSSD